MSLLISEGKDQGKAKQNKRISHRRKPLDRKNGPVWITKIVKKEEGKGGVKGDGRSLNRLIV